MLNKNEATCLMKNEIAKYVHDNRENMTLDDLALRGNDDHLDIITEKLYALCVDFSKVE